jgi:hypothetical protein
MAGMDGIETVGGTGEQKLMPDEPSAIWIQRDDTFLLLAPLAGYRPDVRKSAALSCHANENLQPERFIQEMFGVFVIMRDALRAIQRPGPAIAFVVLEIADHFQAKGLRLVVGQGVR